MAAGYAEEVLGKSLDVSGVAFRLGFRGLETSGGLHLGTSWHIFAVGS